MAQIRRHKRMISIGDMTDFSEIWRWDNVNMIVRVWDVSFRHHFYLLIIDNFSMKCFNYNKQLKYI